MLALIALLLTAAPKPQCVADADCSISSACSCECCLSWTAMTKARIKAERNKCSRMGPCDRTHCDDRACAGPDAFKAVCEKGQCATKAQRGVHDR